MLFSMCHPYMCDKLEFFTFIFAVLRGDVTQIIQLIGESLDIDIRFKLVGVARPHRLLATPKCMLFGSTYHPLSTYQVAIQSDV